MAAAPANHAGACSIAKNLISQRPANLVLLAGGPVEIKAAGKTPTVFILAYGGGLMTVPGWGPLVIDLAGLDISSQIGILADHDSTLANAVRLSACSPISRHRGSTTAPSSFCGFATTAAARKRSTSTGFAGSSNSTSIGIHGWLRKTM